MVAIKKSPGPVVHGIASLNQSITAFHRDAAGDWVAKLACGHNQHVRHNPPWTNRPWVATPQGRQSMIGHVLACVKCAEGAPRDR